MSNYAPSLTSAPNPIVEATLAPAKHILLNSQDATASGTTNDVLEWNIVDSELAMFTEGYYKIWVSSAQFPNLVYPINEYNNVFNIQIGINPTSSIIITPNNYTGTTIATYLQTQLNALSLGTFSVTFDSTSYKIGIVNSTNEGFKFMTVDKSIYSNLGIVVDNIIYTTYVTPYPVNLRGTQIVDLITNLQTNVYSTTQVSNFLDRIPITSAFGEVNTYFNYNSTSPVMRMTSLNYIQICFRDASGKPYVLPPNAIITINIWVQPMIINS